MEYVREKATLHELAKTVKAWERKVEIAEVWLILGAAHQEYYHIHFSITDQIQIFVIMIVDFCHFFLRWPWGLTDRHGASCVNKVDSPSDCPQGRLTQCNLLCTDICDIVTHSVNYTINRHIKQVSIQIVGGSYDDTGVATSVKSILHILFHKTTRTTWQNHRFEVFFFLLLPLYNHHSMLLVSGKLPEI